MPDQFAPDDKNVLAEIHAYLWQYNLRATNIVRYERQAFIRRAGNRAGPPRTTSGRRFPVGLHNAGGVDNSRSPADVEQLPLLIRFNEYVSGQTYQGYTAFAIRTGGVADDAAMLQEPVTNFVYRCMGQPAPLTTYTGLRFNNGADTLYVVSEVIEEAYLLSRHQHPVGQPGLACQRERQ